MINKVHIIGMGLMGTNLGIKLVEKGLQVSGDDTVSYTHLTLPTTTPV